MSTLQKLEVMESCFRCVVGFEPWDGVEVEEELAEREDLLPVFLRHPKGV